MTAVVLGFAALLLVGTEIAIHRLLYGSRAWEVFSTRWADRFWRWFPVWRRYQIRKRAKIQFYGR